MSNDHLAEVERFVNRAHDVLDTISYYRLLSLQPDAQGADIKRAYYRLAGRLHPDLFGKQISDDFRQKLTAVYSRVVEGYKVLSTPKRRKLYNEQLDKGVVRLTADAEAAPTRKRPEDQIRNPSAKRMFMLGTQALNSGDKKSATMNFQMALSAEPGNKVIEDALARAKAK